MIFSTQNHGLRGEVTVPGDKSISHRSVMFGAIAKGLTEIDGFLQGADCLSTISCFERMGVSIENRGERVLVFGNGMHGLKEPDGVLDCGNSGTTTRLLSGLLSAQPFCVTLTGDESIRKRPMKRIITPLSQMGASIKSVNNNGCAPFSSRVSASMEFPTSPRWPPPRSNPPSCWPASTQRGRRG